MRNTDFTPLYRTAIGFDRMASMLDNLNSSPQAQPSYPPYNIELIDDNKYRITMALAGFSESDIHIQTEQNILLITGAKPEVSADVTYLHQGIAGRNFERRFQLADHVRVETARLENGLLFVELFREIPEAMKPRTIAIQGANAVTSKPSRVA